MNKKIIKLFGAFAIIFIIVITPIVVLATNENVSVVNTQENEYMIYIKDYTDKNFKYAFTNNANPNEMDLSYINSISDLGGNKCAFLDAETYEKLKNEPIYMWAKDEEENLVLNGVQIDLGNSLTKENINLIENTTKRIAVEVSTSKENTESTEPVRDENIDGVKEVAKAGYVKITDSKVATYYYQRVKTTDSEEYAELVELAEKLNKDKNINVLAAYGGKDIKSQLNKLKRNIQLVIATPGRLLDHLDRKSIDLSKLNTLVLDEADQMILMGFKNEIEAIIKETNKKRQTLCFSATLDSQVKKLAYRYMKDPVEVTIKSKEITLETIKQEVVETTDRHKQEALCKVLDEDNPFMAIIFCRTKRRVDALDEALAVKGYNCEKLHSDIPQAKRERIIKSFRKADLQYLIATDVASRGLDITGITHIYNYDIPETSEDYIHRIGRTGRIGNDGYTCMFVDPKNTKTLEKIESDIKYEIPRRLVELDK